MATKLIGSQTTEQAAQAKPNVRKLKTFAEHIHAEDFQKWIFPDEKKKFYYCHVNLDWLEIRQTPPDLFSMAYETGLNLVGISVAMNVYTEMLMSGQWVHFCPHYYFQFNSPKKYQRNQKIVFDALSRLIGLIAEDLYLAGYYISAAGGGLGVYIPMIMDWLEQVSKYQVQALEVLSKVNRSKEFYFVEYSLRDPVFGALMFNNLTYNATVNPYSHVSDDPNAQMGVNWNFINPQRFEKWMKEYITKVYPGDTDMSTIRREQNLSVYNSTQDSLQFAQKKRQFNEPANSTQDWTVNGVNFSFKISEKREVSNLILKYINKDPERMDEDASAVYQVLKGDEAIEQFFRAGSWFLYHPVITNYLYNVYMMETGQQLGMKKQLWPSLMRSQEDWEKFTQYWVTEYNYGSSLSSAVGTMLASKLTHIASGSGSSGGGSTHPC